MPSIIARGGMPAPALWNLFDELDRVVTPRWTWAPPSAPRGWPAFDMQHTDDAVIMSADVPGLGDDDVDVQLAGRVLTIRGRTTRRAYPSAFERSFELASGLDVERLEASLERGVLTIHVPKTPQTKPRKIALSSGGVLDKVKALLGRDPTTSAESAETS
ncbi:MAG: Hsp20/alpha crystallin family protein [Kofleriaceae bacterium]